MSMFFIAFLFIDTQKYRLKEAIPMMSLKGRRDSTQVKT
jgi:hypothetical protein